MSFGTGKIWMNGSLLDWDDAKIHIGSHLVHLRERRVRRCTVLRNAERVSVFPA